MLCGYEPFYGENEEQLILANKEGKIEFPESDWEAGQYSFAVNLHRNSLIKKCVD
jgi:hypothetical protein